MAICENCGAEIIDGAKFCQSCGCAVVSDSRRQQEYTGTMHKCPNCGEVLQSFVTYCTACGFELRNANATNSVRELAAKLEAIESIRAYQQPYQPNTKLKGDALDSDRRKYYDEMENKIVQPKISLIRNFAIPNTKEDIIEFMIMALTNADNKDKCSSAWETKFFQAYEKAKFVFGNSSDFQRAQGMYEAVNNKIEKREKEERNAGFFLLGLGVFIVVMFIIVSIFQKK